MRISTHASVGFDHILKKSGLLWEKLPEITPNFKGRWEGSHVSLEMAQWKGSIVYQTRAAFGKFFR